MSTEFGRPRVRGAHHLGFSVRNLDRSIAFYCEVLGATLVRPPNDGESLAFAGRMAIVALGPTGLDLFEHAANEQEPFDPAHTGLDHLGFAAESAEELQSWATWLDACDIPHSGIRDVTFGSTRIGAMLDFRDPDGIQLEILYRTNAIREALEVHWAASDANDFDTEHRIYRADAVLEYPQSGERIRGRDHIQASRAAQPNAKRFTVKRILGGGSLWITELVLTYDGQPSYVVSVMEFEGGEVVRETQYFGDPFDPGPSRAQWVEQID